MQKHEIKRKLSSPNRQKLKGQESFRVRKARVSKSRKTCNVESMWDSNLTQSASTKIIIEKWIYFKVSKNHQQEKEQRKESLNISELMREEERGRT